MRTPKLCYHRGVRKWYITLDGREVYLSPPVRHTRRPPDDVRAAYDRAVSAWLGARAQQPVPVGTDPSMADLWKGYRAHLETRVTQAELYSCTMACGMAARMFGSLPARKFGPKALLEVRSELAKGGGKRKHVNGQVSRIRRMFKWGVSQELVPETTWRALKAVEGLRAGEHGLVESEPISDVPNEVIEATLAHLPSTLADLVRVHRLIGCRIDEACELTTGQLERLPDPLSPTGEVWRFTPGESKNQATYWVGPRAQAVLLPRLRPEASDAWLFPTRAHSGGRGCYSRQQYARRITLATEAANLARAAADPPLPALPHWTPLQIRHAAGEEARSGHPKGLEATQARLRHRHLQISEVYAHDLDELGKDVARRMG